MSVQLLQRNDVADRRGDSPTELISVEVPERATINE